MKILIVYYSRTGTTKRLAEMMAKEIKADVEEIIDKKKRGGIIGWIIGGRDGLNKIPTQIEPIKNNPANYDLVLIGGPLWGFKSVAPASRTYLVQNKNKIKKTAFFMTKGGKNSGKPAFLDLKDVYGKEAVGTLDIVQRELDSPETIKKIKSFLSTVTR